MQKLESIGFDKVEDNLTSMLKVLENDQLFLRYVLNLNSYPLDVSYYDNGNVVPQPDIPMSYDLVENGIVNLDLFNPIIEQNSKISIFFSPLNGISAEVDPISHDRYTIDIVVPYNLRNIVDDKGNNRLRLFRIADRIDKLWNQQYDIAGMGRLIRCSWKAYIINSSYQGINLMFKVDNSTFTDEEGEQ